MGYGIELYHVQVNFPVYFANMLKTMRGDSLALEVKLEEEGAPNAFRSEPVASCKDWSHLQSFNFHTLICTQALKSTGNAWRKAVEAATLGSESRTGIHGLLTSLKSLERKVSPTTHAFVLLMPTQKLLKQLIEEEPEIAPTALAAAVKERSKAFIQFYMAGTVSASGLTLAEALDIYEEFHILESLPQKWSKDHLFKCNCPVCFKTASCAHVLLASMVCDKSIEVPIQYLSASLQHRRRGPGRPSAKGTGRNKDEKAAAELKCRDKAGLSSQRKKYKVPTVSSFMVGVACSV